mmetsp:Transcript_48352/g.149211  ORF Transcript_48352/g.149211 Transcript_48352/m.149211 type:complete len:272 (-) Transcript_48352:505-1320(-)
MIRVGRANHSRKLRRVPLLDTEPARDRSSYSSISVACADPFANDHSAVPPNPVAHSTTRGEGSDPSIQQSAIQRMIPARFVFFPSACGVLTARPFDSVVPCDVVATCMASAASVRHPVDRLWAESWWLRPPSSSGVCTAQTSRSRRWWRRWPPRPCGVPCGGALRCMCGVAAFGDRRFSSSAARPGTGSGGASPTTIVVPGSGSVAHDSIGWVYGESACAGVLTPLLRIVLGVAGLREPRVEVGLRARSALGGVLFGRLRQLLRAAAEETV